MQPIQGGVSQNVQAEPVIAQPAKPIFGSSSTDYAPSAKGYPVLQNHPVAPYIDKPGTVDLTHRQMINNPENPSNPDPRHYGSEYSARTTMPDGRQMSYPTIYDGRVHKPQEAFDHAQKTGQYLNIFKKGTPEKLMSDSENVLHSRDINVGGKKLDGESWAEMNGKDWEKYAKANDKPVSKPMLQGHVEMQAGDTSKTQGMFRQRNNWKMPTNDHVEGTVK